MFTDSYGSISSQVCTSTATRGQYVSRRPIPDRELIVRVPITTPVNTRTLGITSNNGMTCPKCGTFDKSSRVSCCAPGGAWYKNCGGAGSRNVGHRWFEGVDACKCKSKANTMQIDPLSDQSVIVIMFSSLFFINAQICTLAVTTTIISSVCPKCGIIAKSGKISCCGRGGSWF